MKESKYCFNCGEEIAKNADTCIKCGAKQQGTTLNNIFISGNKNKITAGLLGLFLGGLGIHKFYLGENGIGIIYLLINTVGWFITIWLAGIPNIIIGIIVLIESIVLLTMSDEEFDSRYN